MKQALKSIDKGLEKTFCFPQAESELEAKTAQSLDQFIAVEKRMAIFLYPFRSPFLYCIRVNPQIDLASIHSMFVILLPVAFATHGLLPFLLGR